MVIAFRFYCLTAHIKSHIQDEALSGEKLAFFHGTGVPLAFIEQNKCEIAVLWTNKEIMLG